eukprot:m.460070 g.460070  ORF g.460070 m.460070 type:complete len:54 (+) comp20342_c6_seq22:87-248(+)
MTQVAPGTPPIASQDLAGLAKDTRACWACRVTHHLEVKQQQELGLRAEDNSRK